MWRWLIIKIKDSTALGAVAGIVATIPQLVFDFIMVQLGYSGYYAFQLSGSIYLLKRFTDDILGFVLGGIIWESMAMFLGIITVFYMRFTGKDYWWLKGIVVSNVIMFAAIYGFLYSLGAAKIVPFDIPTNFTVLIGNIIFGLTKSYLVVRWGDESLLRH